MSLREGIVISRGSTCKLAGIMPDSIVAIILIRELIPLAISECPIFDFTEPTGRGSFLFSQNIFAIAAHSVTSPKGVPVKNRLVVNVNVIFQCTSK